MRTGLFLYPAFAPWGEVPGNYSDPDATRSRYLLELTFLTGVAMACAERESIKQGQMYGIENIVLAATKNVL